MSLASNNASSRVASLIPNERPWTSTLFYLQDLGHTGLGCNTFVFNSAQTLWIRESHFSSRRHVVLYMFHTCIRQGTYRYLLKYYFKKKKTISSLSINSKVNQSVWLFRPLCTKMQGWVSGKDFAIREQLELIDQLSCKPGLAGRGGGVSDIDIDPHRL